MEIRYKGLDTTNCIRSPLTWVGSKHQIISSHKIHEYIDETRIQQRHPYMEVFCGSAIMFFNLNACDAHLNDADGNLINFWRVVQKKHEELEEILKYRWADYTHHDDLLNDDTDVNRAAHFLLNNFSHFSQSKLKHIEKEWDKWARILNESRTNITQKDAIELIDQACQWKAKPSYIFCDPPYFGTENMYKEGEGFDHEKLAKTVRKYKDTEVTFLITYKKEKEILDLYEGFYIKKFNTVNKYTSEKQCELLISNHPLIRHNKQNHSIIDFC